MSTPGENWIAFIDLLGTKESASLSNEELYNSQRRFQDFLSGYASNLSSSDRLFPFADSCYIEFTDVNAIAPFIQALRYQLFGLGYFFKCAIGPGNLDYEATRSREVGAKIVGGRFGPDVVPVYRAHEAFKGVGTTLLRPRSAEDGGPSTHEASWLTLRASSVRSCFPSAKPGRAATLEEYADIAYGPNEVGDGDPDSSSTREARSYVRSIFRKAFESKIKNVGYGKYYLSCIIAMANSSPFERFELIDKTWSGAPPVFEELFPSGRGSKRMKAFSDISGIEIAYFTCMQKIFDVLERDAFLTFVTTLVNEQWLMKRISKVPTRFLSNRCRNDILSVMSDHGLS